MKHRDRNVNAWHFCENIVSWCDTLVLFVSIRFFLAIFFWAFFLFISILIQKLLHLIAWDCLLSLSMILFWCFICKKNWKFYCINFCLHLVCAIIFATMMTTTATITTNRTSFYLIIYFDVCGFIFHSSDLYHYNQQRFPLSVCVYKIFTLTFAFILRWYYFFGVSLSF